MEDRKIEEFSRYLKKFEIIIDSKILEIFCNNLSIFMYRESYTKNKTLILVRMNFQAPSSFKNSKKIPLSLK